MANREEAIVVDDTNDLVMQGVVRMQDLELDRCRPDPDPLPRAEKPRLNARAFPEKPLLEKTDRHVRVHWHGEDIADSKRAYWVLQTHRPPMYYIPPEDIKVELNKTGFYPPCQFLGLKMHYALGPLDAVDGSTIANRIWTIEQPNEGYEPIAGYFCFYHGPWACFVDGEEVRPVPGSLLGGWATKEIYGLEDGQEDGRHGPRLPLRLEWLLKEHHH